MPLARPLHQAIQHDRQMGHTLSCSITQRSGASPFLDYDARTTTRSVSNFEWWGNSPQDTLDTTRFTEEVKGQPATAWTTTAQINTTWLLDHQGQERGRSEVTRNWADSSHTQNMWPGYGKGGISPQATLATTYNPSEHLWKGKQVEANTVCTSVGLAHMRPN